MGSERSLWNTVRKNLSPYMHLTRHEDSVSPGTPDVSYGYASRNGWIELKHVDDFPVREATPIRVRHFTDEQKLFLEERGKEGGYCWVLLQVGNEYFLFNHTVVNLIGELPRKELTETAHKHWKRRIRWDELMLTLQERVN